MIFGRKTIAVAIAAAALSGATLVPYATGLAFGDESQTQVSDVELLAEAGLPTADANPYRLDASVTEPTISLDDARDAAIAPAPAPIPAVVVADAGMDGELECLAKIVLHEAGNQGRDGQLAVAQVVMNRVNSGRFADTICGVALQRNQFFNVHAYHPPRDGRWETAVEIARDARAAASPPVVADALFFHAAQANPPFFRSRQRVAQLGNHVFYR